MLLMTDASDKTQSNEGPPRKRNFRRRPQMVCPKCGVPMLVRCTRGSVRYLYCPAGCRFPKPNKEER
jgi:hypothetical protein